MSRSRVACVLRMPDFYDLSRLRLGYGRAGVGYSLSRVSKGACVGYDLNMADIEQGKTCVGYELSWVLKGA